MSGVQSSLAENAVKVFGEALSVIQIGLHAQIAMVADARHVNLQGGYTIAASLGLSNIQSPILSECINPTCPISGEPVAPDSLTLYKGHTVGFGEPEDRDKFAAAPDDFPDAIQQFDQRIAEENL